MENINNIEAIVLDIEGTTTPIDFVYKVLFPYSSKRLVEFINDPNNKDNIAFDLQTLKTEFDADKECSIADYDPVTYLQYLIKIDRKSPALKSIQGKIWEEGFRSGEIKGELFSDVPRALERWRSAGYKTYIYSSGSVLAQKLLFQFSVAGNLTCFLYGHFDTSIGAKVDFDSYAKIASKIRVNPANILFISDAPKELDAATIAGLQTRFSNRPGNTFANTVYQEITNFDFL